MMYLEIFYPPQKKAFHIFEQETDVIKSNRFFLAGGTALALQIGHRRSVDFDFFTPLGFDPPSLLREVLKIFPGGKIQKEGKNTLTILWNEVQLSFFGGITLHHLRPPIVTPAFPMFSIPDIAAMKIAAMLQRKALRDYFDLAYLLHSKELSVSQIMKGFYEKYGEQGKTYPESFLLRTLSYVHDLPSDPVSVMKDKGFWGEKNIRKKIGEVMEDHIRRYLKEK